MIPNLITVGTNDNWDERSFVTTNFHFPELTMMATTDSSTEDLSAPIFSEDPVEVKKRAILAMAGPTLLMKGKSCEISPIIKIWNKTMLSIDS